jgi:WD40 repeat protein
VLEQWLLFFMGRSHVISELPQFLAQEAANQPAGPIADRASDWLRFNDRRFWFRWINKRAADTAHEMTLVAGTAPVTDCLWLADGREILSASDDGTLLIWDARTGRRKNSWRTGGPAHVSWLSSDTQCMHSAEGRALMRWSIDAGTMENVLTLDAGRWCCVSADGTAAVSLTGEYTITFWDLVARRMRLSIDVPRDAETKAAQSLQIYTSFGMVRPLGSQLVDCCFSREASQLVCRSTYGSLTAVEAETGRITARTENTSAAHLMFSPDGEAVITCSADGVLRIWDAITLRLKDELDTRVKGVSACTSSTPFVLGTESGVVTMVGYDASVTLGSHIGRISRCRVSPDGARLASGSVDGTLKIWNLSRVKNADDSARSALVEPWTFNCDAERLLARDRADGSVKVWDVRTGRVASELDRLGDAVNNFALAPDESKIAAIESRLVPAEAPQPQEFTSLDGRSMRIVHTGTIKLALSILDTRTAAVLNVPIERPEEAQSFKVPPCAFSEDGRWITTRVEVGSRERVYVRSAETGRDAGGKQYDEALARGSFDQMDTRTAVREHRVIAASGFINTRSPDRAFWLDNTGTRVVLQNIRTRDAVTLDTGQRGLVSGAFCPSGREFVIATATGGLQVWSLKSVTELFSIPHVSRGAGEVRGCWCVVSNDGRWAITLANRRAISLWDLEERVHSAVWIAPDTITDVACRFPLRTVVARSEAGALHMLECDNLRCGVPIVTAQALPHGADARHGSALRAGCPWCLRRFDVLQELAETLVALMGDATDHVAGALDLPDDAWNDDRLLSRCPACHRELRFNPFVADLPRELLLSAALREIEVPSRPPLMVQPKAPPTEKWWKRLFS